MFWSGQIFIKHTNVLPLDDSSWALVALWAAITCGRFLGLRDQLALLNGPAEPLFRHLYYWLVTSGLGMGIMLVWTHDSWALWSGLVLYGLGNGPCCGYLFDLNNRLTVPSETGMAVVMLGLNLGASLVPYAVAEIWEVTDWAYVLLDAVFATMVLPVFLLMALGVFHRHDGPASVRVVDL